MRWLEGLIRAERIVIRTIMKKAEGECERSSSASSAAASRARRACASVWERVWGCFTGSMKEFLTERHVEPPRRSGHWTGTAAQTNRGRPGESGELSEPTRSFNVTATLSQTAGAAAREASCAQRHGIATNQATKKCSARVPAGHAAARIFFFVAV